MECEELDKLDWDSLEDAHFEFDEKAFNPDTLHCIDCSIKMKKTKLNIRVDDTITATIEGYKCPKCNKETMTFKQAETLEKALAFSKSLKKQFRNETQTKFRWRQFHMQNP